MAEDDRKPIECVINKKTVYQGTLGPLPRELFCTVRREGQDQYSAPGTSVIDCPGSQAQAVTPRSTAATEVEYMIRLYAGHGHLHLEQLARIRRAVTRSALGNPCA